MERMSEGSLRGTVVPLGEEESVIVLKGRLELGATPQFLPQTGPFPEDPLVPGLTTLVDDGVKIESARASVTRVCPIQSEDRQDHEPGVLRRLRLDGVRPRAPREPLPGDRQHRQRLTVRHACAPRAAHEWPVDPPFSDDIAC